MELPKDVPAPDSPFPEPGAVYAATLADLELVDRADHPLGRAALVLARKLDEGHDTAAGLSAAAKQLEATLSAAKRGALASTATQSHRDELAERRAKHA